MKHNMFMKNWSDISAMDLTRVWRCVPWPLTLMKWHDTDVEVNAKLVVLPGILLYIIGNMDRSTNSCLLKTFKDTLVTTRHQIRFCKSICLRVYQSYNITFYLVNQFEGLNIYLVLSWPCTRGIVFGWPANVLFLRQVKYLKSLRSIYHWGKKSNPKFWRFFSTWYMESDIAKLKTVLMPVDKNIRQILTCNLFSSENVYHEK